MRIADMPEQEPFTNEFDGGSLQEVFDEIPPSYEEFVDAMASLKGNSKTSDPTEE